MTTGDVYGYDEPDPLVFPKIDPSIGKPVTRHSIQSLQKKYEDGDTSPLDDVMVAFQEMKKKVVEDSQSYYYIGGIHGEPYTAPEPHVTENYAGGWCNHANVLFPTWHRAYCYYIEMVMQKFVPGVALPFLDEASAEFKENGVPTCLTDRKWKVRGVLIDNPLYSYTLAREIVGFTPGSNIRSTTKPEGYTTVRYPYSGFVANEKNRKDTAKNNELYASAKGQTDATFLFNYNVKARTNGTEENDTAGTTAHGTAYKYEQCLNAKNYTVFSNTTSEAHSNEDISPDDDGYHIALETPHNEAHVYMGGGGENATIEEAVKMGYPRDVIKKAGGDMGMTNTAGMDPIFFLHHCFIDRVFWLWQVRHGHTHSFDIIKDYPGTVTNKSYVDDQGRRRTVPIAAGQTDGEVLTLDSGLHPFVITDESHPDKKRPLNSNDMINIANIGYEYGEGSLDEFKDKNDVNNQIENLRGPRVVINGIRRDKFIGSFTIRAHADTEEGREFLGSHEVFTAQDASTCANCQNYMNISTVFLLGKKSTAHHRRHKNLPVHVSFRGRHREDDEHKTSQANTSEISYRIIG